MKQAWHREMLLSKSPGDLPINFIMREAMAEAVCPSNKSSSSLKEFASTIKSF